MSALWDILIIIKFAALLKFIIVKYHVYFLVSFGWHIHSRRGMDWGHPLKLEPSRVCPLPLGPAMITKGPSPFLLSWALLPLPSLLLPNFATKAAGAVKGLSSLANQLRRKEEAPFASTPFTAMFHCKNSAMWGSEGPFSFLCLAKEEGKGLFHCHHPLPHNKHKLFF